MRIEIKAIASRLLVIVMTLAIMTGVFTFSTEIAYASSADVKAAVEPYGADKFGNLLDTNTQLSTNPDYDHIELTVNGTNQTYYYKKTDEQAILNKAKSLKGQAQVQKLDEYYSLEADTEAASNLVSGLKGPISTFLGLLVVFITVGMTIFTAFDLCYIAFPIFRGKMDDAKANGTKIATRTNDKGETKLNFITDDAQFAVIASETAQTGRNAYLIYFKKRVISFVILAVLIFILLTGNINIIVNIGIKLASGIIEAISNSFQ